MVTYVDSAEGIRAERLAGFFVGWPNPPSCETHLRILLGGDEAILALDDATGSVVGFITAITDGVIAAYIPHLEVLPTFQGRGIGQELLRRMLERLGDYYMVDLLCDPDVQPFYEKAGMRPCSGMLVRRYERQSGS